MLLFKHTYHKCTHCFSGLGSILFAITIDRTELNKPYGGGLQLGSGGEISVPGTVDDEPRAVIAADAHTADGGDPSIIGGYPFWILFVLFFCFSLFCVVLFFYFVFYILLGKSENVTDHSMQVCV